MPPMHWLAAVSGPRINPQSCTQTMRETFVTPVSMSTSTSANWTPLVPLADSPASHSPSTETGSVLSSRHASFHDSPFDASSFDWMRPLTATSDAASTPIVGATRANSASRALPDVTRTAGATDGDVVLPPDPPLNG